MSTLLNSLKLRRAWQVRCGWCWPCAIGSVPRAERYHRKGFSAKIKPGANRRTATALRSNGPKQAGLRATAGVNQPVLNLSWVLPTSQLDACEALWVNQSRPDFTASNNTFG